jgi:hypothetical protein
MATRIQLRLGTLVICLVWAISLLAQPKLPRETTNAALRYWMAFAEMQDPPADKATTELLEKVAAGVAPWDETTLGWILDRNAEALSTMQRASKLPECDWGLEYTRGSLTPIEHLARARTLGRLNAVLGARQAGRGETDEAIDTWISGIRFSQDVAHAGSLISLLSARGILSAHLRIMTTTFQNVSLTDKQKRKISVVVNNLPETGFDWAAAWQFEEAVAEAAIAKDLTSMNDERAEQTAKLGVDPMKAKILLDPRYFDAYRKFMRDVSEALILPPSIAEPRLTALRESEKTLNPVFQEYTPSFERANAVRAELQTERTNLLDQLNRKHK